MKRVIAGASLMVCLAFGAYGQDETHRPVFAVASIRPNRSRDRGSMEFPKGRERFLATNMPLAAIVMVAYNLTVRQISGSSPLLGERYDIVAKAEHPAGPDEMLRMLQTLLADRFQLVVRRETREVPVWVLTVAKGGPKLHESDLPPGEGAGPRTPERAGGTEPRSGHLIFRNESMADFAWALSRTAAVGDRVVVDRTGLRANYDFELTFVRDSPPSTATGVSDPAAREGPGIFSALQEQLGLKLEAAKAPVEFVIVEHVERPTEN
jgi:uncharacterized protein (TIGR03435 family)